jgi:acetyltransferase-like isoleucine patch superfamily enzyme
VADRLGEGLVSPADFGEYGEGTALEPGVRVFGARHVYLGKAVYLGHDTFLRAYPDGLLRIGDGCWIGPGCFINAFGGVTLGRRVGVGPGVRILSSAHAGGAPGTPILDTPLRAAPVEVEEGADLGTGAILLPGVKVGAFAQVGAGAVVSASVEAGAVVAGVPARPVRPVRPGRGEE